MQTNSNSNSSKSKSTMRSFKLMFLTTFLSLILYKNSNAQMTVCYIVTIVNNQSACQWDVEGLKGVSTQKWNLHAAPGTVTTNCRDYANDSLTTIKLTLDNRCSPIFFSVAGGWAETITQSCSPSCSTPGATVVCTETVSSACTVVGGKTCISTAEITITIN